MVENRTFHQNNSFGEIEKYKEWLKLRVGSILTFNTYLRIIKAFFKEYNELTEDNIIAFLKKHSYGWDYYGAIKKYLQFLGKEDLLKNVPKPKSIKKFFEIPDLDKLIEKVVQKIDGDEKYIFLILYYTGARISEILNLKLKDLNLKEDYIVFRKTKGNYQERAVRIPIELKKHLIELKTEKEGLLAEDFIFYPDSKNTPRARYYRFLKRIKLKYPEFYKVLTKTHNFRRAFITWMYMQTKDVFQVQQYVGHSNINVTVGYIQEIARKEAIEKGGELVISKKPMPKGL